MELPRDVGALCRRDGLVVTANLCEVGCLEFQSELHQRIGNISGGFIGDGIFGRFGPAACVFSWSLPGLLFDFVLHAEAQAFDDDRVGVMQDTVEDCGGQRAVVVEDLGPMLVDAIGGDHDRRAFVALADDLEQQVCAVLVDRQVTELVDNQYGWLQVAVEFAPELADGLCRAASW